MKKIVLLLVVLSLSLGLSAQSLIGAWESTTTNEKGEKIKNVVIFTEGYQVATWYHADTGKFISTNGGLWTINGNTVTETVEFDTETSERVGSSVSFDIAYTDTTLSIVGVEKKWKRIDSGIPGKLNGAWLMSGRVRNGNMQQRDTSRPRKTMKILSGTRFQWIAYNTETKQFMGTGGGTYTTINGKYTENIKFFSRDNSRVGASLKFDFSLKDGAWHHEGFSSKGAALHEVWSLRK
tara:strand:- start:70374 stop:71084 length:711 start_codon:yes stop_codon:yes gene_type:complete